MYVREWKNNKLTAIGRALSRAFALPDEFSSMDKLTYAQMRALLDRDDTVVLDATFDSPCGEDAQYLFAKIALKLRHSRWGRKRSNWIVLYVSGAGYSYTRERAITWWNALEDTSHATLEDARKKSVYFSSNPYKEQQHSYLEEFELRDKRSREELKDVLRDQMTRYPEDASDKGNELSRFADALGLECDMDAVMDEAEMAERAGVALGDLAEVWS